MIKVVYDYVRAPKPARLCVPAPRVGSTPAWDALSRAVASMRL